nr:hypothetical protein [Tanacetum cinerariifolium]
MEADDQQMMKGSEIGTQKKKAKLFNEWERFTSTGGESVEANELRAERLARTHDPLAPMANSNNPYNYPVFHQDQPSQIAYQNGNDNVVAAWAKGNGNGNNGNQDEIAPIANQVDARVQNFKNQFVKEATKFVQDFKSLIKEADESLDKITVLKNKNERLLREVVSQDIMSIVQSTSIVDTSNL